MLSVGTTAPLDITVQDEAGKPISLRSLTGQYAVVYFYPKDDTPGCTTEACNFRDALTEFDKRGVAVIGISKDSVASHEKFKNKYQLNFPLWSDPEHVLLSAFGVWQEKKMMGKTYMGVVRTTFVLDPRGTVVKVWENVNPKHHEQEILEFLAQHLPASP